VLGCGLVSRSHLPVLRASPHARVDVVADLDAQRAQGAAAEVGSRWTTRPDEVLSDPAVEAVAVLLPHHLHAEPVLAALRQGKHVFVEKPMALMLADCAAMIRAAEAAGRVLAVGQVLRCRHAHRLAREAIAAGAIGRPVHTVRRRYARRGQETGQLAWAERESASGGLLYGNGSHEVDAVLWMLDGRPDEVYARGGTLPEEEARGASELSLSVALAGGGHLTLTMSRGTSQAAWDQWTVGSTGSLYLAGQELVVNGERRPVPEQPGGGFAEEWAAFASAVRDGEAGTAGGSDGDGGHPPCAIGARTVWPTMVALECARESIRTGRPSRASEVDRWRLYDSAPPSADAGG
jgi:predicted dehydrogenase